MEQSTLWDRQSEHTSSSLAAWGDNEITYVDVPFSWRQLSNGPGLWFPPVRGILGSSISLKLGLIDSKQVQGALNGKCYFSEKCGTERGKERPRHIILLHIIFAAWHGAFPFDIQPDARDDVTHFPACYSLVERHLSALFLKRCTALWVHMHIFIGVYSLYACSALALSAILLPI